MQFLTNIYKKTGILHHAYLIEGRAKDLLPELIAFFETNIGIKTSGNPDFWHGSFETVGIEEGRLIKERQSLMAFSEGVKIFIISAGGITHEAQNALLKVFEEPTPRTHFFIILPSAESLLPTFLSRLFRHTYVQKEEIIDRLAVEFLSLPPAKRLVILKPIIEDKNKTSAISFIGSTEKHLKGFKKDITPNDVFVFEEIIACRSYLHDRSPSVKIILEYLSLIIPVLS